MWMSLDNSCWSLLLQFKTVLIFVLWCASFIKYKIKQLFFSSGTDLSLNSNEFLNTLLQCFFDCVHTHEKYFSFPCSFYVITLVYFCIIHMFVAVLTALFYAAFSLFVNHTHTNEKIIFFIVSSTSTSSACWYSSSFLVSLPGLGRHVTVTIWG